MAIYVSSSHQAAQKIFEVLGKDVRLGTPLGAGKPNHLLNALYDQAKLDPTQRLTILTALTLERPKGRSLLEKNFLDPMVERVFGNYPDLNFELDRVQGKIPSHISVVEFYFPAGKFIRNAYAQQNYISSNYTHVARDLLARKVNLVVQQIAVRVKNGKKEFSLSCNADVTPDLFEAFKLKKNQGERCLVVGQVNDRLPFMLGDALLGEEDFDIIVDQPSEYYEVFSPPKASVGDAEYMIGLYGSALVKDGGELQIGIGALGDSIVHSLVSRHSNNSHYRQMVDDLQIGSRFSDVLKDVGSLETFQEGLFAGTEMFVDGFMHLYKAKILKRRVFDDLYIQRLINEQKISEEITPRTLELLIGQGRISDALSLSEFHYLQKWGVFREDLKFESGVLIHPDGSSCEAHVGKLESRKFIFEKCLGKRLKNAAVLHGGFCVGPAQFYQFLRDLPEEERSLFQMKSVSKINQLYGHEDIDRLHRKEARFVNTCLMMTLSGAAVSDALSDGHVVSGIGGQYNFVSQAHALPGGRSILNLRSVRGAGDSLRSNIVWNYGHISIPRHLRDIVITEYGIADLRAKTDQEIIAALLNITDSRFQNDLLNVAKKHSKIAKDYTIPREHQNNFPEVYSVGLKKWKTQGFFPRFPFGTDLTEDEVEIAGALKRLKFKMSGGVLNKAGALSEALKPLSNSDRVTRLMKRMSLDAPKNFEERIMARLLRRELTSQ